MVKARMTLGFLSAVDCKAQGRHGINVSSMDSSVELHDFPNLRDKLTPMAKDGGWVFPAIVLLVAQHASALLVSYSVGFTERPPTLSYMVMALVLASIGGLAILLRRLWQLWRENEGRPLARLRTETSLAPVATYFVGFQLVALQIAALTWLKEMLPLAVPYWADGFLAQLDRVVLGADAWRLVPAILVPPLDWLYTTWAPVKFFALVVMLALPPSELKARALFSYFLTVGLVGVSGQYLLSSGGPIFYDRLMLTNDFAALADRTREFAPVAHLASEYLWQSYLARDTSIGNGISAMPSMHVATTTWAAITLGRLWPKSAVPVWSFWFIILVGSVALGWHYLSDGVIGAGGAYLCWKVAPNIMAKFKGLYRQDAAVA
jgi:hypothetical protein